MTLLGGTGVVGLVAAFAIKNILENYFSGIMLSLRRPFIVGDVIEVAGERGTVYTLSTRGTTLIDFEGTYIFIPNSTVMNSIIKNHSSGTRSKAAKTLPPEPRPPSENVRQF
jgi:small-conductance mechanosensitive channel